MLRARLLVLAAACLVARGAGAATLTLSAGTLEVRIGSFPAVTLDHSGPIPVLVSDPDGSLTLPADLFGPATVPIPRAGTTTFTGSALPSFSAFTFFGLGNAALDFDGAQGSGVGGLRGTAVLNILQVLNLTIPLTVVGVPGATAQAGAGSIVITVLGAGWTTGTARVTGLQSTTPGGEIVHTRTVTGSDGRTPGHAGSLTLVSASRALTNVSGTLPIFAIQTFHFVPEPPPAGLWMGGIGAMLGWSAWRRRRRATGTPQATRRTRRKNA